MQRLRQNAGNPAILKDLCLQRMRDGKRPGFERGGEHTRKGYCRACRKLRLWRRGERNAPRGSRKPGASALVCHHVALTREGTIAHLIPTQKKQEHSVTAWARGGMVNTLLSHSRDSRFDPGRAHLQRFPVRSTFRRSEMVRCCARAQLRSRASPLTCFLYVSILISNALP